MPEKSCVVIPKDVPFDVAGLVGCAVTTGVGAVWNTAGVRPGDRVAIIGCGGVGLSALMAAVAVGAEPVIAVDATPGKLEAARSFGATDGVLWAGSAEATAEAVREASGGGVDYAIEATGRPEAMTAAFLSTRARGAAVLIGIPREDATVTLPALSIAADGAADPRLDLRLIEAGARFPDDPRCLSRRAAPARSPDLAPPPARRGRTRLRADAVRRGAARRPRSDTRDEHRHEPRRPRRPDRRGLGRARAQRHPRERRPRTARQPDRRSGALDVRAPVARAHAGALLRRPVPAGVRADLAADADDEQGDRDGRAPRDDHLGCGSARDRPGRARRGCRRPDRGDGRPARARRDLGRGRRRGRDGRARGRAHRCPQGRGNVRAGP